MSVVMLDEFLLICATHKTTMGSDFGSQSLLTRASFFLPPHDRTHDCGTHS